MFSLTHPSCSVAVSSSNIQKGPAYMNNIMLIPVWVQSYPSRNLQEGNKNHIYIQMTEEQQSGLRHCHLGPKNSYKVDVTRKQATHWVKPDCAETTRIKQDVRKSFWTGHWLKGYSVFKAASVDGCSIFMRFLMSRPLPQLYPTQLLPY